MGPDKKNSGNTATLFCRYYKQSGIGRGKKCKEQ
jgi:hypothetical protein